MARNGSGTYTNPYPNFVSGTVISSTEVDTNNSQIATALTQSIAVDGQSVVTADLPLATHKFTGMKVGTAATDSLTLGQAQAEAFVWCGTATGSADAIVLTPSPPITAYAAGQRFVWMASSLTNTAATTVAISGLSAIALQDNGAALTAGQHAASKMFMGILNTTSTVQIMQVQVSGTDPLIVSSLTVDGNSQFNGTITAGVDDTGYDVQFFGATSGAYMLWDESADDLLLVGAAGLNVAGSTVLASVDVTAVATAATFEPDGDTSAGDTAALGYTAALGAILTGQGSTNDVTLVNDADATVLSIPTGTTNVDIVGSATAATFEPDGDSAAADNAAIGYTAAEGLILTGQGSTDDITVKNNADTTVLNVATGATDVEVSAGNLLFGTAAKGVYLGVTSATAANLLDDYEEGTFTATFIGATTAPSTAVTATGVYTKIGNFVNASVYFGNKNTTGISGDIQVTGMPFVNSGHITVGTYLSQYMHSTGDAASTAYLAAGGTTVQMRYGINNSSWASATARVTTGGNFVLNMGYSTT